MPAEMSSKYADKAIIVLGDPTHDLTIRKQPLDSLPNRALIRGVIELLKKRNEARCIAYFDGANVHRQTVPPAHLPDSDCPMAFRERALTNHRLVPGDDAAWPPTGQVASRRFAGAKGFSLRLPCGGP